MNADSGLTLHTIRSGQGETIVLLHGLFGSAANLGLLQKHLQDNYHVVAMDLRNHGASPHSPGMRYDRLAADVTRTLDQLQLRTATLIGHSMGGKVAMRLALDQPDRVERLAVLDIAPVRYQPAFRPYAQAMLNLILAPDLTRRDAEAQLAPAIPDARIRGFLMQNLRFGPPPQWRIGLREIADALPDIEDWPTEPEGAFRKPVWFLSGARSDYVVPRYHPIMAALFPDHRRATVSEAGHWLHADNPAGLLAQLDMFLAADRR